MKELDYICHLNQSDFLSINIYHQLFQQFFEKGKRFFHKQFCGLIENIDNFCEELEKIENVSKVFETTDDDEKTIQYFFKHHYISVYVPSSNKITVDLVTDEKDFLERISLFLNNKFKEIEKSKQIHMIAPDEYSEQISLYPMGDISLPINRQNYDKEVLKKVDYIIKELNSENPAGRMVLIEGPSGVGKSYIIRGILKELNFGTCVLIPASMLDNLDKPTLIPLLMKNKRAVRNKVLEEISTEKSKPIILIIEDADSVLVPRSADNMSAISSLLNYTDGIFGSLFDIRIIATTNALRVEIEKSLLRPGRLLKRIHVDLLSTKKAEEIFERLTNQKRNFEKEVSLATVYSLAKGNEIDEAADEDQQHTVGF